MRALKVLLTATTALTLMVGCSSIIHHDVEIDRSLPTLEVTPARPLREVTFSLSAETQEHLAKGLAFDTERLFRTVSNVLTEKKLLNPDVQPEQALKMEVVIRQIYYRSKGRGYAPNFPGNEDTVHGDMIVKDASGKVIKKFSVKIDNQEGGYVKGGAEGRMSRLCRGYGELIYKALAEIDPWQK